jgi:hypothetical protein
LYIDDTSIAAYLWSLSRPGVPKYNVGWRCAGSRCFCENNDFVGVCNKYNPVRCFRADLERKNGFNIVVMELKDNRKYSDRAISRLLSLQRVID